MDKEVAVLAPPPEFNFDSGCSTPYISAPSSPQRFGTFFSAPASPRLASAFFRELDHFSLLDASSSKAPAAARPEKLKSDSRDFRGDEDFEFSFSGPLPRASLSADELFDGGKIKPLEPPIHGFRHSQASESRKSRRQQHRDRILARETYSEETDSGTGQEQSSRRGGEKRPTCDSSYLSSIAKDSRSLSSIGVPGRSSASDSSRPRRIFDQLDGKKRAGGKENRAGAREEQSSSRAKESKSKSNDSSPSGSVRRGLRSAANLRISDILSGTDENPGSSSTSSSSSVSLAAAAAKGLKKWLFRSKSEGHESREDQPQRKYALLSRRSEEAKGASFRSTAERGGGGGSASMSRRRGPVSAHELHYKANRAVSEEMRRKTFLPYKQDLLGCLGFNPCAREISKGFGSLTRG